MSKIIWSDEFLIGIPEIDQEHQELIGLCNEFFDAQDGQADRKAVLAILNRIYIEVHDHFMLEERLMERYAYDQYDLHKAEHDQLLDEIKDTLQALEQGQSCDVEGLHGRLSGWFANHFKTHDARLHNLHTLILKDQEAGGPFASLFGEDTGEYWGKKG